MTDNPTTSTTSRTTSSSGGSGGSGGRARQVLALRVDTDGHQDGGEVPARALGWPLRELLGVTGTTADGGGVGSERLDVDLVMWFDEDGAEHARPNPTASVVARAFGSAGQVFGPVLFTGCDERGNPADLSAAASVLLAGMGAGCGQTTPDQRARAWADLGVLVVDPTTDPAGPGVSVPAPRDGHLDAETSFDALAHTVTRDGDMPRCAECGEPGSHPEHQPEQLADSTDGLVLAGAAR